MIESERSQWLPIDQPKSLRPRSRSRSSPDSYGSPMNSGGNLSLRARIPGGPISEKWDKHRFELKLINPANKRHLDVIVVGTGLAGASAAAVSRGP